MSKKTYTLAQATAIFTQTDKLYKIKNDIDLNNGTLTLPTGCTLDFQGGIIKNGTIIVSDRCTLLGNGSKCTVSSDMTLFVIIGKCIIDGFEIEVTEQNYTSSVIHIRRNDNSSPLIGSRLSNIDIDFTGSAARTSGNGILMQSTPSADNSNGIAWMSFDNILVRRANCAFHLQCVNSVVGNYGWINSNTFTGCVAWGCRTTLYFDTARTLEMISYNNFGIASQTDTDIVDGESIIKTNNTSFYHFIEYNRFIDYVWDFNDKQPYGGLAIGDYSTLNNIPYKLHLEVDKYKLIGIITKSGYSLVHFTLHSDRDLFKGEYYVYGKTNPSQMATSQRPILLYYKAVGEQFYIYAKVNTNIINQAYVGFVIINESIGFIPRLSDDNPINVSDITLTAIGENYRLASTALATPSLPSGNAYLQGVCAFTNLGYPAWWNGSKWVDANGISYQSKKRGTTAQRPTPTSSDAGFQYYDTDLGKYICWNGTAWINMDGSALS